MTTEADVQFEIEDVYYRTGFRHQLSRDFSMYVARFGIFPLEPGGNEFVQLTIDGRLIVRKHYAWDGASGPALNDRAFVRPSLVHDALYQLIREGVIGQDGRRLADRLLRKMLRKDMLIIARRLPFAQRWAMRALAMVRPEWVKLAVRLGGGVAMAMHSDEILTAP